MVGVLALNDAVMRDIAAAVARARKNPTPWEVAKPRVVDDPGPYLTLADRKPGPRPQVESVDVPIGYRLNISFEVQPSGLCEHISVSSPDPVNNLPNEHAMALIATACGMQWPPGPHSRIWVEDFIAGPLVGKAVNLVEVVDMGLQQ